jgi:DNA-binding transcriptional regulator YdaS (Cro superfamily)
VQLKRYLRQHRLVVPEFARLVRTQPDAVRKWINGDRLPAPDSMKAIFEVTKGAVSPNDFYDLPKLPPEFAHEDV